jgi:glycerol-3-phosphate dehydrogenase
VLPIGPATREENVERLGRETFDLAVVGGGITGAGIALDAAARGLKTALVDKGDFASGTSSRSSKMVHGGLRYLAQYDFALTWEAARERDLLRRLAPGLVRPMRFLYPILRRGREASFVALGLTVYDVVAGRRGFGRHRRARPATVRDLAPSLDVSRLRAAWTYWDAVTDDARLVFEILRAAHSRGAVVANHAKVEGFDRAGGKIRAVRLVDATGGRTLEVRARAFVNATGVWAGEVSRLEDPAAAPRLRPAKGIHLAVPAGAIRLGAACIVPSGARDGRSLFAAPWGDVVMLGTTDTEYDGPLDRPVVGEEDVDYVLGGINRFLQAGLDRADVVAAWAGLRPLLADERARTADLSRRHAITVTRAGLITITGGKLTTYRRMAADAVDRVCAGLGVRARSGTARLPIGISGPLEALLASTRALAAEIGADPALPRRLVEAYGDQAPAVLGLAADEPALARPVSAASPAIGAQVVWAARHEMTGTLEDVLARRTRLALLDPTGGLGGDAAALVARTLRWSDERRRQEVAAYAANLEAERGPVAPLRIASAETDPPR